MSAKLNLVLVALVAFSTFASVLAQYEGYIYAPRKMRDPLKAKGDERTLVPQVEVEDDEEEYITDSLVAASNSINAKLAAPDSKQAYTGPDLVAAGDNQGSSEDETQGKRRRRRMKKDQGKQTESEQSEVAAENERGSVKKEQENQGERLTHAKGVKLADKFRELNREHDKHSDVKTDAGERHKNYIKIYHRETSARIKKLATPEDEKKVEQQLAEAESTNKQQQMEPSPSDNTQVETPTPGPLSSSSVAPTEPTNGPPKGNLLDQLRTHLGAGGKNRNARRMRRKNNKKNGKNQNKLTANGGKVEEKSGNNNNSGNNKRRRRRRRKPKKSGNANRRRVQRKPQASQEETNEPPK